MKWKPFMHLQCALWPLFSGRSSSRNSDNQLIITVTLVMERSSNFVPASVYLFKGHSRSSLKSSIWPGKILECRTIKPLLIHFNDHKSFSFESHNHYYSRYVHSAISSSFLIPFHCVVRSSWSMYQNSKHFVFQFLLSKYGHSEILSQVHLLGNNIALEIFDTFGTFSWNMLFYRFNERGIR